MRSDIIITIVPSTQVSKWNNKSPSHIFYASLKISFVIINSDWYVLAF